MYESCLAGAFIGSSSQKLIGFSSTGICAMSEIESRDLGIIGVFPIPIIYIYIAFIMNGYFYGMTYNGYFLGIPMKCRIIFILFHDIPSFLPKTVGFIHHSSPFLTTNVLSYPFLLSLTIPNVRFMALALPHSWTYSRITPLSTWYAIWNITHLHMG
jgi:hypothetical protein